MKGRFNVLMLTKHAKHSVMNSVYGIAQEFINNKNINLVDIATSSIAENNLFFSGRASKLFVRKVDPKFSFESSRDNLKWKERFVDVTNYDYIIMRLPPPLNIKFVENITKILGEDKIINNPKASIIFGSKKSLLMFSKYCPPIKLINTFEELIEFCSKYQVVLKPLNEHGGVGIVMVKDNIVTDGENKMALKNYWLQLSFNNKKMLAMKFLEGVINGDKRIVVANGKIISSVLRKSAPGSWICNVARGGLEEKCEVTLREREIVTAVSNILLPKGVVLFAIDTLEEKGVRYLSEINCTSVGGIVPASKLYKKNFTKIIVSEIISFMKKKKSVNE